MRKAARSCLKYVHSKHDLYYSPSPDTRDMTTNLFARAQIPNWSTANRFVTSQFDPTVGGQFIQVRCDV